MTNSTNKHAVIIIGRFFSRLWARSPYARHPSWCRMKPTHAGYRRRFLLSVATTSPIGASPVAPLVQVCSTSFVFHLLKRCLHIVEVRWTKNGAGDLSLEREMTPLVVPFNGKKTTLILLSIIKNTHKYSTVYSILDEQYPFSRSVLDLQQQ